MIGAALVSTQEDPDWTRTLKVGQSVGTGKGLGKVVSVLLDEATVKFSSGKIVNVPLDKLISQKEYTEISDAPFQNGDTVIYRCVRNDKPWMIN